MKELVSPRPVGYRLSDIILCSCATVRNGFTQNGTKFYQFAINLLLPENQIHLNYIHSKSSAYGERASKSTADNSSTFLTSSPAKDSGNN
eukprot:CCRYP_018022-RA/>CCRYP_018022-RA protein AED:0.39 eAED:0.39 QI:0/-1/0/1/-1/1/1/0/89